MKHAIFALVLAATLPGPVLAQDDAIDPAEGRSLMEQGARLLMEGLMAQMAPTLDDLRGSLDEMSSGISAFLTQVDDLRNYTLPEFMPNGDIILRRRPDAPDWTPPPTSAPDTGEVEL